MAATPPKKITCPKTTGISTSRVTKQIQKEILSAVSSKTQRKGYFCYVAYTYVASYFTNNV